MTGRLTYLPIILKIYHREKESDIRDQRMVRMCLIHRIKEGFQENQAPGATVGICRRSAPSRRGKDRGPQMSCQAG